MIGPSLPTLTEVRIARLQALDAYHSHPNLYPRPYAEELRVPGPPPRKPVGWVFGVEAWMRFAKHTHPQDFYGAVTGWLTRPETLMGWPVELVFDRTCIHEWGIRYA